LTARKVVKCFYIIRKNSFVDKKTRDSIIDREDSFTRCALQPIFNLDNGVGGIDGTPENRDKIWIDHSGIIKNKTPPSIRKAGFLLNSVMSK